MFSCLNNLPSCQNPSVYPSKLRDCNLSSSFCFDTGQETGVWVSFSLNLWYKSFAVSSNTYIFAMFFMVLDLRLTKVGTRRSPFFVYIPTVKPSEPIVPPSFFSTVSLFFRSIIRIFSCYNKNYIVYFFSLLTFS